MKMHMAVGIACLVSLALEPAKASDFSGRIHRIRLRENQNDTTFRVVVVVGDTTQQVDKVRVSFGGVPGQPSVSPSVVLASPAVDQPAAGFRVFEADVTLPGPKPTDARYPAQVTMLGADGSPLAPTEALEAACGGAIPWRIRVRPEKADDLFTLTAIVNSTPDTADAAFAQVVFEAPPAGAPEAIPTTAIATPLSTQPGERARRFRFAPLTFAGGRPPLGRVYAMKATLLDRDGAPLGSSERIEAVIESREVATFSLRDTLADGNGNFRVQFRNEVQGEGALRFWDLGGWLSGKLQMTQLGLPPMVVVAFPSAPGAERAFGAPTSSELGETWSGRGKVALDGKSATVSLEGGLFTRQGKQLATFRGDTSVVPVTRTTPLDSTDGIVLLDVVVDDLEAGSSDDGCSNHMQLELLVVQQPGTAGARVEVRRKARYGQCMVFAGVKVDDVVVGPITATLAGVKIPLDRRSSTSTYIWQDAAVVEAVKDFLPVRTGLTEIEWMVVDPATGDLRDSGSAAIDAQVHDLVAANVELDGIEAPTDLSGWALSFELRSTDLNSISGGGVRCTRLSGKLGDESVECSYAGGDRLTATFLLQMPPDVQGTEREVVFQPFDLSGKPLSLGGTCSLTVAVGEKCALQFSEPGMPPTTATVVLHRGAPVLRIQVVTGGYVLNTPRDGTPFFSPAYPLADATIELLDDADATTLLWSAGRGPVQLTGRGAYSAAASNLTYRASLQASIILPAADLEGAQLGLGAVSSSPGLCAPGTLPSECRPSGRISFTLPAPGQSTSACTEAPCVLERACVEEPALQGGASDGKPPRRYYLFEGCYKYE